jgi:histidinol phosphatase-like enzyme (inositol monophosphatase family)
MTEYPRASAIDVKGVSARLEHATFLARKAGASILKVFQDPNLKIDLKKDRTLVTAADRNGEKILRSGILEIFPDDKIVGEEFGVTEGRSGWTWYLDPIDGTQAFARGVPLFGTLIGLEYCGEPAAGVIFLPALGEMVYAGHQLGCHWIAGMTRDHSGEFIGGTKSTAQVSKTSSMKDALFCTTWMQSFRDAGCLPLFAEMTEATGVFRGWGDCYGYALVATGRAEIMIDPILESWDAGPMPIILQEAGGSYTTFDGRISIHGRSGVATNRLLHEPVLEITKRYVTSRSDRDT